MSVAAPARARREARERTLADRFLAAVPLLSVFSWLCVVYAWQAWNHGTPWLFTDELQFTQLARSIADTGHAARRGQPHSSDSLYTWYMAPAWWIHDVRHAYGAVKDMNVVAMTATVFPTYGLARFVVGRRAALFAATGAAIIPSLAFSAMIVEENVAYPYSTLCLYLIMGALLRRTRWWIGGAVVGSLVAPAVRGELIVIPVVFALAAIALAWRSDAVTKWSARWSATDWIGFLVLVVGAAVLVSAILGHGSHEWLIATGFYKHRIFTLGMQAAGALTIGLGVFPVVAGLAALWRGPGETYRPELRVFRCVLLSGVIGFWTYTAVKSSYLSTVFGTYVVERNLIYVSPLLLVGTALWLERRRVHPVAAALATLAVLYLILTTPYEMEFHFYSQSPGFSLLEWLNRTSPGLTPHEAKGLLLIILAGSALILIAARLVPRASLPLAVFAAAFVIVWTGGGELAGGAASNSIATSFLSNIKGNPTWLDKATGGAPALYLGQQIQDADSEWLLEFWNRSLKDVWSLDGTAPGPGPILTPDLHKLDGTLSPDPHRPYVVVERGIQLVGTPVAHQLHKAGGVYQNWTLYRVGEPLRLQSAIVGISPDGWSGPNQSSYTRYGKVGGGAGTVRILVSRESWPQGGKDAVGHVTILMGLVKIGSDKQPHLGKLTAVRHWAVHGHRARLFTIRAPGPRFRVEVSITPTFVPAKISTYSVDLRELGAQVQYTFVPPHAKRR